MSDSRFRSGEELTAAKLNRIIRDVGADAGEAAAIGVAEAGGIVILSGADTTGVVEASTAINAAIVTTAAARQTLYIGKGTYRLAAQLNVASNMDLWCHPEAEFIAYFNSTGRNGIVGMSTAAWAATPATPLTNIRIRGGIWRRNGSVAVDGKTWSGNTGNVFSFWAEHVEIADAWITGYHLGRVVLGGGRYWVLDNIRAYNPANYLNLPCPGVGGTGAFRWYSGGPMVATRLHAVCGDDCFQTVPGATDSIGVDVSDITYSDCYGVSIKARVCVAALVVPNALPEELQNSQTIGIKNVTFRTIRGEGKIACAFYNTDSTGLLGTILFDDVRLGVRADLDGAVSTYAVELLATDRTAGVGPIIFRDSELLNVIEGGIRARGTEIGRIQFIRWLQPAPSNAASASYPVHIQDAEEVIFEGGSVAGAAASTKSVVYLGRTDAATEVAYARIEGTEITNVPDAAYGVYGPTYGFTHLEMRRVRMTPVAGATDARAIRFSEISATGTIEGNDFSALGATPYVNTNPGIQFRHNILSAASVNGILHQQIAAASSVEWDSRSKLIRLTSSGPVTLDTLALPSGFVIHDIPVVYLMGVNANTITVSNAGNILPAGGSASLTQNTIISLVYDHVSAKWLQA